MDTLINIGMFLTYILAIGALAAILFFAIVFVVKNFNQAKGSLVGIGILLLVFVIAYIASPSNDIPVLFFEKNHANPELSKLIGSGLISLYIFIFGVFAAVLYSQFVKFIKK